MNLDLDPWFLEKFPGKRFLVMTHILVRDFNILLKKELPSSLWVFIPTAPNRSVLCFSIDSRVATISIISYTLSPKDRRLVLFCDS